MAIAPPKVICLGFVLLLIVLLGLAEAVPISRGRFLAEDGYKVVKNNEKTEEKNSGGEHEKTIKEVERQKPGGQEKEKYEKEKKEKEKQESEMKERYEREKQEKEKKENYEKQMYEKEKRDKYQKEKMEKEKSEKYQKESGEKVSYEKYESESGEKSKSEKHEKENEENVKYEKHTKESGSKQNSESAQKEKYENEKREEEMKEKEEKEKYEREQKEKYEKEKREKEEKENRENHGKYNSDDDTDGSSSTPVPYPSTSGRKRVRCRNINYPQCYGQVHVCPSSCASTCEVDCVTCKPVCSCDYPGAVCQDPRFIGGDGITFYFHGKKNKDFCIVSDTNLHINAHFIGKRSLNMGRDFTWVESLGILFNNHKLFIGARKTVTWDDSIDRLAMTLDGEPIFLDETEGFTWRSATTPTMSVTRISNTNSVVLDVQGILKITTKVVPITEKDSRIHHYGITKDDCFAHLDLSFKFYSLGRKVEGVLGRTYRDDYVSTVKMGIAMPVVGGEAEYETSGLFETDCSVARFQTMGLTMDEDSITNLSSLSCASGMGEAGVVCKR